MSYPPPAMLPFIDTPVLHPVPPRGADWLHEVKFDGWRVQLHKYGTFVQLYSRGGHKGARRFLDLVAVLARIPARSCVIDGEVVACDNGGVPEFHALHFLREGREVCIWAFDLLYLDAKDVRGLRGPSWDVVALMDAAGSQRCVHGAGGRRTLRKP